MNDTREPTVLELPKVYLVRMMVFMLVVSILAVVLFPHMQRAFMANAGLNGVIVGALLLGVIYSFRLVWRLWPEINWVNGFRVANPGLELTHTPKLLGPMATLFRDRPNRTVLSPLSMRSLLDSLASRLDEARDISRYMVGLLIFLGLLGTFWGLLETVTSVGDAIRSLDVTSAQSATVFEELKTGLQAPLSGMGLAFSSSLFGLAGSLVLGFLDLQTSQAQNAFYTDLEDWMTSMTELDHPVSAMQANAGGPEMQAMFDKLGSSMQNQNSSQNAIRAMAELARGIDGLVKHIRTEQDDLRKHIDEQGETNRKLRDLIEAVLSQGDNERRS